VSPRGDFATVVRAGGVYFLVVFGFGFLFGVVRVLLLVPRLGERTAELIEMPLMLAVIALAARRLVRRHSALHVGQWLSVGGLALGMLLAAELTLAWLMSGLDPLAYAASRDPVSGAAYAIGLLVFALAPAAVRRLR
jgi:hypothetical protein